MVIRTCLQQSHGLPMSTFRGPNDERAQDNLDIAHHLFLMSLNGELYLAPITQKPERVLDIGTGTGIWAMDFADQHPATEVVGTDLSPIQPRWTPPNCKFEIDDANDDWTFAKNSFDFIHVRYLLGCISDWPRFYGQVMEYTRRFPHSCRRVRLTSLLGTLSLGHTWSRSSCRRISSLKTIQ